MAASKQSAEQLITDNIEVWSSAIKKRGSQGRGSSKKIELYGIKKLRELILELAVRGLLVPQDPSDEPASVLLEKIAAEKEQLIKDGKIKKQKPLSVITEEEKPFTLPKGWEFVRLGSIISISSGAGLTAAKMNREGSIPVYGGNGVTGHHDAGNVKKETLVIGRVGFYCGSVHVTPKLAWVTDNAFITKFSEDNISLMYLSWLLKATNLNENDSATAQPVISGRKVYPIVIALPPTKEQPRIVAKVNELMALCDQLEQQTETSLTAHQTLVETLLNTLLTAAQTMPTNTNKAASSANSSQESSFDQAWNRIAQHFDVLFTTEHSIDQLKQTILQLAVMGKLVPQDPSDEPASVLLEKIAAEKEQLIKDKKIKKQKALPPIDDEKPFELPSGWGLTRLDDICYSVTSGSTPPKTEFNEDEGVPYLKVYNIKNQEIAFDYKPQYVSAEYNATKLKRSILYPGDVVMNIVGPPLGKVAIIPDSHPEWNCNQAITFFRPIVSSLNTYIYTYLLAGTFLHSIELIGTAGQDNISVTKSRSIILPLPPVKEQLRIVSRVNELMAICDSLKLRVNESWSTQLHLADAMAENALV